MALYSLIVLTCHSETIRSLTRAAGYWPMSEVNWRPRNELRWRAAAAIFCTQQWKQCM